MSLPSEEYLPAFTGPDCECRCIYYQIGTDLYWVPVSGDMDRGCITHNFVALTKADALQYVHQELRQDNEKDPNRRYTRAEEVLHTIRLGSSIYHDPNFPIPTRKEK